MIEQVFTVDHARRIAEAVTMINRRYLELVDRQASYDGTPRGSTSPQMSEIMGEWQVAIHKLCHDYMDGLNSIVAGYQQIAADAVSRTPPRPILMGVVRHKNGDIKDNAISNLEIVEEP